MKTTRFPKPCSHLFMVIGKESKMRTLSRIFKSGPQKVARKSCLCVKHQPTGESTQRFLSLSQPPKLVIIGQAKPLHFCKSERNFKRACLDIGPQKSVIEYMKSREYNNAAGSKDCQLKIAYSISVRERLLPINW